MSQPDQSDGKKWENPLVEQGSTFSRLEVPTTPEYDYVEWGKESRGWRKLLAAVTGGAAVGTPEGSAYAAKLVNAQSVADAASAFFLVHETLTWLENFIRNQSAAIAGPNRAWQGPAADAFITKMDWFAEILGKQADRLAGLDGVKSPNSVPNQLYHSANYLYWAQEAMHQIDYGWAAIASKNGVGGANNMVSISGTPYERPMTQQMVEVVDTLGKQYDFNAGVVQPVGDGGLKVTDPVKPQPQPQPQPQPTFTTPPPLTTPPPFTTPSFTTPTFTTPPLATPPAITPPNITVPDLTPPAVGGPPPPAVNPPSLAAPPGLGGPGSGGPGSGLPGFDPPVIAAPGPGIGGPGSGGPGSGANGPGLPPPVFNPPTLPGLPGAGQPGNGNGNGPGVTPPVFNPPTLPGLPGSGLPGSGPGAGFPGPGAGFPGPGTGAPGSGTGFPGDGTNGPGITLPIVNAPNIPGAPGSGAGMPGMPLLPGPGGGSPGGGSVGIPEKPDANGLLGGNQQPWQPNAPGGVNGPNAPAGAFPGGLGLANPGVGLPMMPGMPGPAGSNAGNATGIPEKPDANGLLATNPDDWQPNTQGIDVPETPTGALPGGPGLAAPGGPGGIPGGPGLGAPGVPASGADPTDRPATPPMLPGLPMPVGAGAPGPSRPSRRLGTDDRDWRTDDGTATPADGGPDAQQNTKDRPPGVVVVPTTVNLSIVDPVVDAGTAAAAVTGGLVGGLLAAAAGQPPPLPGAGERTGLMAANGQRVEERDELDRPDAAEMLREDEQNWGGAPDRIPVPVMRADPDDVSGWDDLTDATWLTGQLAQSEPDERPPDA